MVQPNGGSREIKRYIHPRHSFLGFAAIVAPSASLVPELHLEIIIFADGLQEGLTTGAVRS